MTLQFHLCLRPDGASISDGDLPRLSHSSGGDEEKREGCQGADCNPGAKTRIGFGQCGQFGKPQFNPEQVRDRGRKEEEGEEPSERAFLQTTLSPC